MVGALLSDILVIILAGLVLTKFNIKNTFKGFNSVDIETPEPLVEAKPKAELTGLDKLLNMDWKYDGK